MKVVCLLPVRNGEADLPGFLESASTFADAVVALDDGSSDRTAELLRASPLVETLLQNPRRETYAGWDDRENRQRLLGAAGASRPDWVVFLDADERLDAEDGAALRAFLEQDALRACAYGFMHHRMWGELHDPQARWVYRAFAWREDLELEGGRLHFNPVPSAIDRTRWIRTTIRIRHLGAADERRRLERLAKYAEADPEGDWPTDFGGLDREPAAELLPWPERPAHRPVLYDPAAVPGPPPREAEDEPGGPRLVVLLPVRNGAAHLPGWFESVGRFADAVVALDDGSTDETRAILDAEPLVRTVLTTPRRDSYEGWDDRENRQRLLEAAAVLRPAWILSLDADERIDEGDGRALRTFVETEAVPGLAYGFLVYRMLAGGEAWDRADLWAFRLFAHEPGQTFPEARLHFVPVPEEIPRERWHTTTIRIQHLAGVDEAARRARFDKYREADPALEFQASYENLLTPTGPARPWTTRAEDEPVLSEAGGELPLAESDLEGPVLSAIVIARDDGERLARAVGAVQAQKVAEPFEIIVVVSGAPRTARIVRDRFPEVTLIELERPALPGAARNAGMRVAKGDYVTFPGSHVELVPGSLEARLRAHELGYPMVTGTTLNGTRTTAGWASYFLDHAAALPGRPSGPLRGPPGHCSYAREFLLRAGAFPEDRRAGEDTVANFAMLRLGYRAYHAQDVRLIHHSPCRTVPKLLRHHFLRGRGMGRILLEGSGPASGIPDRMAASRRFLRGYLRRRMRTTDVAVEAWGGDLRPLYRRVRPLVQAGAAAAWAGSWYEILRTRWSRASELRSRSR